MCSTTTAMRTPRWVPWVYLGPAVAVMAVACLVPLLSALQLGFYDWSLGTPWGEAKWVGTDAFVAAFRTPRCGAHSSPR
jgi:multiple sugar transport system permease protein